MIKPEKDSKSISPIYIDFILLILLYKQKLNKSGILYILHFKINSVMVLSFLDLFKFLNKYGIKGVFLPSKINSGDIIFIIFILFFVFYINIIILIINFVISMIYLSHD